MWSTEVSILSGDFSLGFIQLYVCKYIDISSKFHHRGNMRCTNANINRISLVTSWRKLKTDEDMLLYLFNCHL